MEPVVPVVNNEDKESWEEAKRQDTVEAYQVYLEQYRQGKYAGYARAAVKKLEREAAEETERKAEAVRLRQETERQARAAAEQQVAEAKRQTEALIQAEAKRKADAAAQAAETKRKAEAEAKRQPAQTYRDLTTGMELALIPKGCFEMGSPAGEPERSSDQGPQHQVCFDQPFYLGKTEVTQGQWEAVMGSNPPYFKGANLPVEQVSWDDSRLSLAS